MKKLLLLIVPVAFVLTPADQEAQNRQQAKIKSESMENKYQVRLITVDPGHFHAALVQKRMYEQVSPDVHVYAPEGPDCQQHLARIESYNYKNG